MIKTISGISRTYLTLSRTFRTLVIISKSDLHNNMRILKNFLNVFDASSGQKFASFHKLRIIDLPVIT